MIKAQLPMPSEKAKHYPSELHLDEGDLPAVKNWKTGGVYTIRLKVKQVKSGFSPFEDDSDKEKVHATFHVLEAKEHKFEKLPYEREAVEKAKENL